MSKITRDELRYCFYNIPQCEGLDRSMERINQREAEFAELVEAAIKIKNDDTMMADYVLREESAQLLESLDRKVKPFIPPPPSPADRLDALADKMHFRSMFTEEKETRAIAAELRRVRDETQ